MPVRWRLRYIPKCGKSSDGKESALPTRLLNWVPIVSPTLLASDTHTRRFEGFVYVDGQLEEENQDVMGFHLSEKWKMFLNRGLVMWL